MKIAVTSTKGGSGKTTSAMHIAAGLARDAKTLLIDSDPQGSALSWANKADLPFDVIVAARVDRDVERQSQNYEHIVIDTPPGNIKAIVQAIKAAEHVILTAQPTPADLDKVFEVDDLVNDERDEDTNLPTLHVLLTRVIKRTNAQLESRQVLKNNVLDLFDAEIYNKQAYAMAHGDVIDELYDYADVIAELFQIHKETT